MIEFTVPAKEFKKALRFILVGREEYSQADVVDFLVRAADLEICTTGTSVHLEACVYSAGYARLPLLLLKKIKKLASSYNKPKLSIRIDKERFRIESFAMVEEGIELKPIGPRITDVPIDATVLDLLAIQKLYSAEEIADSGLAARVAEAQQKSASDLNSAMLSLSRYGIPREVIRDLIDAHVSLHANATRSSEAQTREAER